MFIYGSELLNNDANMFQVRSILCLEQHVWDWLQVFWCLGDYPAVSNPYPNLAMTPNNLPILLLTFFCGGPYQHNEIWCHDGSDNLTNRNQNTTSRICVWAMVSQLLPLKQKTTVNSVALIEVIQRILLQEWLQWAYRWLIDPSAVRLFKANLNTWLLLLR